MGLFTSVALGWLLRRLGDWGGWIASIAGIGIAIYGNLTPNDQHAVIQASQQIVTGNWREIPLGQVVSILGIISLVWSQRASFKATTLPQIVTEAGKQASLKELPQAKATTVEEFANTAIERRGETIVERLLKLKLGRR
jgi:hypothetical protein